MVYCGIDEVGRGPLAGPVTAVAVVLPNRPLPPIKDSKSLSAIKRKTIVYALRSAGVVWGSGWVSPKKIDAINIRRATLLAMQRAYTQLSQKLMTSNKPQPDYALIDGNDPPELPVPCITVVKGDTVVPEIQAASILAKHARDSIMNEFAVKFPLYLFEKNKGYPTQMHRRKIQSYGLTPIHRQTFRVSPSPSKTP